MIQDCIAVLDDHATAHIGAPCYVVVENPNRCSLCFSYVPLNTALWIPSREESLLYKHPDGLLFGGYIYFFCFECRKEMGEYVPVLAKEWIRSQLDDALRGSGDFTLEEVGS